MDGGVARAVDPLAPFQDVAVQRRGCRLIARHTLDGCEIALRDQCALVIRAENAAEQLECIFQNADGVLEVTLLIEVNAQVTGRDGDTDVIVAQEAPAHFEGFAIERGGFGKIATRIEHGAQVVERTGQARIAVLRPRSCASSLFLRATADASAIETTYKTRSGPAMSNCEATSGGVRIAATMNTPTTPKRQFRRRKSGGRIPHAVRIVDTSGN